MTWQKNATIKWANIVEVPKGPTGTYMRLIDAADPAQGPQLTASTSRKRCYFTEAFKILCNIRFLFLFLNREDLSAHRPVTSMEDHTMSTVHYPLFNAFPATIHVCKPSPISAIYGRAIIW
jgi:hypothetical protein